MFLQHLLSVDKAELLLSCHSIFIRHWVAVPKNLCNRVKRRRLARVADTHQNARWIVVSQAVRPKSSLIDMHHQHVLAILAKRHHRDTVRHRRIDRIADDRGKALSHGVDVVKSRHRAVIVDADIERASQRIRKGHQHLADRLFRPFALELTIEAFEKRNLNFHANAFRLIV